MKKLPPKPKPEYQLDIIIPVYGQADLLTRCIAALPDAAQGVPYRLIVVDDCGPEQDKLGAVYHSLNGNSKLIRNKQNSGFARTVNTGVAIGSAPYILLLNSDCILQPGAISAMLKEFDRRADVGVVGCKLLFGDSRWQNEGKIQHAGIVKSIAGHLIHANLGWSADHPMVNQRREMQAVTGACMMTRRKVWQMITAEYRKYGDPTVGAMNEVYGAGCFEDVELCLAAKAQGYKTVYTPDAVGLHFVGASISAVNGAFPVGRNSMIFNARCGHLMEWDEWKWY